MKKEGNLPTNEDGADFQPFGNHPYPLIVFYLGRVSIHPPNQLH